VNRKREHRIYAVRKDRCASCGRAEVRDVPARLATRPGSALADRERALLRESLQREIARKVRFEPGEETTGYLQ
jgi:hypothetical protein